MEEDGARREAGCVRVAKTNFHMGQHVRISKEKMRFAKAVEQNFSSAKFSVAIVIEMRP